MKCPVCNIDLSELDTVSRYEHVDLCCENGPSLLVPTENGQLVVKSSLPPAKQRKICPICCKTFQTLSTHYKTCALKNDVIPSIMLEHWDKINADTNSKKQFPRDLLDRYVAKCVKEGRVGEQVDFARALILSIAENDPKKISENDDVIATGPNRLTHDEVVDSAEISSVPTSSSVIQPPLTNALMKTKLNISQQQQKSFQSTNCQKNKRKYRIEMVDTEVKQYNIELRIDRELAATRIRRYQEALELSHKHAEVAGSTIDCDNKRVSVETNDEDNHDCILLSSSEGDCEASQEPSLQLPAPSANLSQVDFTKLFFKSRLRKCNSSSTCSLCKCDQMDHDFELTIDGFHKYTLPLEVSMDDKSPEKRKVETDLEDHHRA